MSGIMMCHTLTDNKSQRVRGENEIECATIALKNKVATNITALPAFSMGWSVCSIVGGLSQMSDFDLDAALGNLKKAKNTVGDGAERAKKNSKQSYSSRANYEIGCSDCGWSAERIQARGVIRKVLTGNDENVTCTKCGSGAVYVDEK